MSHFSAITIIYNPKSTGSGKQLAEELQRELRAKLPKQKIELMATKYIGNAEELAYEAARASAKPLVISASGDGGYHEVVNGLLRAQQKGAKPTAGLLPAGNANDHFRNVHTGNVVEAICNGDVQVLDVLRLRATYRGKPYERFAHSYISLGASAAIADALNNNNTKHALFQEVWLGLRVTLRFHPTRLKLNGTIRTFYGLIFSNVSTMAKWFTVARHASSSDGKFEVINFRSGTKLGVIANAFVVALFGYRRPEVVRSYAFETVDDTLMQLDGEVIRLDADCKVSIDLEHKALRCIV